MEKALHEKNEWLCLIADALPVLIAYIDRTERYRFNNATYKSWHGLSPQELNGKTVREMLGEKDYEKVAPYIRDAFAGTKQSFETSLCFHAAGERAVHVHCIPHRDPAGEISGLCILVADVTEHRKAEEEIRQLNTDLEQRVAERTAQLEATNKELEAFCYSVSHDLRAPLRTIRGFSDVLLEQHSNQLDERGSDFLRRTSDASRRMDRLIEDLLRLSRVTCGELRRQELNLSSVVEELASGLKKNDPSRAVEFKIAPDLRAHGDELLLRVVLDNLLNNAWKFTSKKENARIEFGYSHGADPAFFIRDNGAGFDMAYADKLFGLFQRLHCSSEFPGTGVGLATVQRIINRHGGKIWASAKPNEGATFYFTLPTEKGFLKNPPDREPAFQI